MPVRHAVRGPAGTLACWEWPGGAPPALLLHGIGNYGRVWDLVADSVAGRLRLVAPDARGHGMSVTPAEGFAPEEFVADGDTVVALGHLSWKHKDTGAPASVKMAQVWTFRDGKAASFQQHVDTVRVRQLS